MSSKPALLARLPRWLTRSLLVGAIVVGLLAVLFIFRAPLLQAAGRFLVVERLPPQPVPAFVLSGASGERAQGAVSGWRAGYFSRFICTGELVPDLLAEQGVCKPEAELTADMLLQKGAPDSLVDTFLVGSSTLEEVQFIDRWMTRHGVDSLAIVSSLFHTRRIHRVMAEILQKPGRRLYLVGAPPLNYNPDYWWLTEEGLIFVNNEYMKLLYYRYAYGI